MANIVYADPFGAALEGKERALRNVLTAAKAGRDLREQDQNYDFQKWHTPFLQQEIQNKANMDALQRFSMLAHYTGDLRPYNEIISKMGYNPQNLPPGYESGQHIGAEQQTSADLGSGLVNPALANPNIYGAGNQFKALPQNPNTQMLDPEMAAMERQVRMKGYQDYLEGSPQTGKNSLPDYVQPEYGLPELPTQASTASPVQNYTRGLPQNARPMVNSIWHGEYDPTKTIGGDSTSPKPYNSDQ